MFLSRRILRRDLRLLGYSILCLMVRPLGLEPRTVSIRRGRHVGDPEGKDSCADGYDTDGQAYDRKS